MLTQGAGSGSCRWAAPWATISHPDGVL